MAKNRPLLPPFTQVALRRGLCALVGLLTFTQVHAQQAAAPAATNNPGDAATDRSTPTALSASERLAIQARQVLAQVKAPPSPIWLEVADEPVLGFWQSDMSGNQEGAVLMLHADGHSPRWPASLLNLHRVLPRFGWATLSVELPPAAPPEVPARQNAPTAAPEAGAQVELGSSSTENDGANRPDQQLSAEQRQPSNAPTVPTAEETERTAMARIQAALQHLQEQNHHNIVLMGQGTGAARALKFASISGAENSPLRALVLVDFSPIDLTGYSPAELLHQLQLPVLDLITSVHFEDRLDATERQQLAKQAQLRGYQVRRITPQAGVVRSHEETLLTKSVRGFISRAAPGKELE